MQAQCQTRLTSIGLLILRVGIGGFMVTHGWSKLQMLRAGQFEMMGDPIGLGPQASLVLIMLAELVCAALVAVGLTTRLAAVPIVFGMAVAAFVAMDSAPWTMGEAARLFFAGETDFPMAKEMPLLFLIPFLALIFTGPGALSLDALIASRRRGGRADRSSVEPAPA